jgi:hypothetical protein
MQQESWRRRNYAGPPATLESDGELQTVSRSQNAENVQSTA